MTVGSSFLSLLNYSHFKIHLLSSHILNKILIVNKPRKQWQLCCQNLCCCTKKQPLFTVKVLCTAHTSISHRLEHFSISLITLNIDKSVFHSFSTAHYLFVPYVSSQQRKSKLFFLSFYVQVANDWCLKFFYTFYYHYYYFYFYFHHYYIFINGMIFRKKNNKNIFGMMKKFFFFLCIRFLFDDIW